MPFPLDPTSLSPGGTEDGGIIPICRKSVSQADVSSGLVFWSSFDTRDIDLGIIFITIFSKVMEVIF